MSLGKKLIAILSITIIFTILTSTTFAKSLYVITKHETSKVAAYQIQDDHLNNQSTADGLPDHAAGAVGLALDPDSGIMFVTYESSNIIEMVNARTLAPLGKSKTVTGVSGPGGLAGIVFDQTRQKPKSK